MEKESKMEISLVKTEKNFRENICHFSERILWGDFGHWEEEDHYDCYRR